MGGYRGWRMLDRFEVITEGAQYVAWPNGGGFQPVTICVNGIDLVELIRRVELPFAEAEYDRRYAAGERDFGERGSLAGDYLCMSAMDTFLPSHNLLGAPYDHGFVAPRTKSILLQCTCGITECWFLLARITVGEDRVVWSDFEQFHRDWTYDLRFEFDRAEYEAQLLP